jgi:hypothetical protein
MREGTLAWKEGLALATPASLGFTLLTWKWMSLDSQLCSHPEIL